MLKLASVINLAWVCVCVPSEGIDHCRALTSSTATFSTSARHSPFGEVKEADDGAATVLAMVLAAAMEEVLALVQAALALVAAVCLVG
eukprot:3740921-Pleurochrysis_carterae.AAC.1